ncbi:unnamed protein product [Rotaria sp. Silwood2]|nr:unnamed protein product [Rotaria sp. Silwood2]CAF3118613.1 unnamed protein product [Rotaria sp. Silwood2]CAF3254006.1 unnamed protein product [Rotaria sp. Silwood2]CAF3358225.1 unnamed protein product [Rotaria sp. Silwood2]CAF4124587.1 unnamed protein product [Rotaria sp. Silwood2]
MAECNLSATKLDEIQNHDDFIVVWFGLDSTELENFVDYFKKYDIFEVATNYITKIQSERKIFLVLAKFFADVSYFNDCHQIQAIYILKKYSPNVNYEHSKLVGTSTDDSTFNNVLR